MDGKGVEVGKFCSSLRKQLFKEHLGTLPEQMFGNSHNLDVTDPLSDDFFLNSWKTTAESNTAIYEKVHLLFTREPDRASTYNLCLALLGVLLHSNWSSLIIWRLGNLSIPDSNGQLQSKLVIQGTEQSSGTFGAVSYEIPLQQQSGTSRHKQGRAGTRLDFHLNFALAHCLPITICRIRQKICVLVLLSTIFYKAVKILHSYVLVQ